MRSVNEWIALGVAEQFAIRALRPAAISLAIVAVCTGSFAAQKSAGPAAGTLIVDGGGATEPDCPALRGNRRRASRGYRRVRDGPFSDSLRGPERHSEPRLAARSQGVDVSTKSI